MTEKLDYAGLKALAERLGRPVNTLVLGYENDPFYANRPTRRAWAEWFAALWREHGFRHGVHLRRIHYVLISTATPVLDINGKRYVNHYNCWCDLGNASRDARYLGLVPIEAFVDQRVGDAVIHFFSRDRRAELGVVEPDLAYLPKISFLEARQTSFAQRHFDPTLIGEFPDPSDYEFEPPLVGQRYHIEIWCEKTTMADVILPLARRYGLNVVMGAGEMSVTHCYQFVERAKRSGKAVRILYLSDFDPQGRNMPVSVARKVEFLIRKDNLEIDMQVRPVALTHEQCVEYQLPRIPIKESAKGRDHFQERFGEGATELDALEALHPGLLRRILVSEIERYHDENIDARISEAAEEFRGELDDVRNEVLDRHRAELEAISERRDDAHQRYLAEWLPTTERSKAELTAIIDRSNFEAASVIDRANAELSPIVDKYWPEMEKIVEDFNSYQAMISNELASGAPDLSEIEWPEPKDDGDEPDPLYDSKRDYVTQIDRYKRHQGKPIAQRKRSSNEAANV